MQKSLLAVTVCVFAVAGTSACATKGYVRTQTGQVSSKVDTLTTSLEATQERTRQNETRIGQVDGVAGGAQTAANAAGAAASVADQKATAADKQAVAVGARVEAVDKATKRVLYDIVLSENQGNFKFGDTVLPDAAKARARFAMQVGLRAESLTASCSSAIAPSIMCCCRYACPR
jgi:hypothetical protein